MAQLAEKCTVEGRREEAAALWARAEAATEAVLPNSNLHLMVVGSAIVARTGSSASSVSEGSSDEGLTNLLAASRRLVADAFGEGLAVWTLLLGSQLRSFAAAQALRIEAQAATTAVLASKASWAETAAEKQTNSADTESKRLDIQCSKWALQVEGADLPSMRRAKMKLSSADFASNGIEGLQLEATPDEIRVTSNRGGGDTRTFAFPCPFKVDAKLVTSKFKKKTAILTVCVVESKLLTLD